MPPFSRLGFIAGALTLGALGVALVSTGRAIFSPGALHAGDSTIVVMGGVRSHAELSRQCGACHAAPLSASSMNERCISCHRDIRGELTDRASLHGAIGARGGTDCTACHTEHQGAVGHLTRAEGFDDAHGQLGFSLAAHRTTAQGDAFQCSSCHRTASFAFDDADCASCHRDYQREFVNRHVADWGTACLACHDGSDRFGTGRFAHDTTSFRLDGGHVRATCTSCHAQVRDRRAFADAPSTCVGCHARDDEHRGGFGSDCASCHSTSTWDGATFSHDVFPLDHGEGGRIACKTCHEDSANYKSYTCYNCHEHSPARVQAEHRGEVRTTNLDDCVRCHRGGRGEGDEHERGNGRERRRDEH